MGLFLNRVKIILFAFLVCLINSSCLKYMADQAKMGAPPVSVRIEKVRKQNITQNFETIGELKADKEITVSAERSGQIERILVSEGDYVSEGRILAQIKGKDVRADLAMAKSDYETYKKLAEEGAVSEREAMRYETDLRRLEAALDNLLINAKISGQVGEIYVDPGDFVSLGDKIMQLIKNKPLRVTYNVTEKIIPVVKLGQKIEITTDSYSQEKFYAHIDFISPRVNPQTRSLLVRAKLDDRGKTLKANQFVKVRQQTKSIDNALLVREESLYLDQGQQFLYLAEEIDQEEKDEVNEKNKMYEADVGYKAILRPVKTGTRIVDEETNQALVEIINGVTEEDIVVYAGLNSIYPGAYLQDVSEDKETKNLDSK